MKMTYCIRLTTDGHNELWHSFGGNFATKDWWNHFRELHKWHIETDPPVLDLTLSIAYYCSCSASTLSLILHLIRTVEENFIVKL